MAGSTQIQELGNLETPIILTNTLSVPTAANALIDYTLRFKANRSVQSVNPVVGETNDGYLNDIRGRPVSQKDVLTTINDAKQVPLSRATWSAGTGTIAFGFKGGIDAPLSARNLERRVMLGLGKTGGITPIAAAIT
ncbi:MAG: P1 family peptidase [Fodinibius sp.]|nr:P1 family peptidase [Fodinibius sp.]